MTSSDPIGSLPPTSCSPAWHADMVIHFLEDLADNGGGRADADTVVSPPSVDVARLAAGALCDAVGRVVAGEDQRALCLVRPPGHHALAERVMGFCLFQQHRRRRGSSTRSRLGAGTDHRLGCASWQRHASDLLRRSASWFFLSPSLAVLPGHRRY